MLQGKSPVSDAGYVEGEAPFESHFSSRSSMKLAGQVGLPTATGQYPGST